MPYLERDQDGKIVGLTAVATPSAQEYRDASDPEVDAFLHQMDADKVRQLLNSSDAEMVRVIEDLVNLLIQKDVICFTDLPIAVQHKLIDRDQARKQIHLLIDDSDHVI